MSQTNHTFAAYFSGELQTSDWQPVKPFLVLDPFTITIVEPQYIVDNTAPNFIIEIPAVIDLAPGEEKTVRLDGVFDPEGDEIRVELAKIEG